MKKLFAIVIALLLVTQALATPTQTDSTENKVNTFISDMVKQHGFDHAKLTTLFKSLQKNERVIRLMNQPYEAKPWYKYRRWFVDQIRVDNGVKFWRKYRGVLRNVSRRTGVPPEMIVAIIGIESRYGNHKGTFSVLDTLYTLSFYYPKRERFFKRELSEFLILCREQGWDPEKIKGSYAGAMGQPQFMPSSYRAYAKAYHDDPKVNLFDFEPDVIASVAHYFQRHGWRRNQPIAVPALIKGKVAKNLHVVSRSTRLKKPQRSLLNFSKFGVRPDGKIASDHKSILLGLETKTSTAYWLGFYNFYVITRYNKSILYAMAATQLAEKIKQHYQQRYG